MIFDYPERREERLHGPDGYTVYESYRSWLRDEFLFRCVYCLKRETWGQVTGDFELDHFEPQSVKPSRKLSYDNLVYSCRRCNATKSDSIVSDPFVELCRHQLNCGDDGKLSAQSKTAHRLIRVLDLNSPKMVEWRLMWLRIIEMASQNDETLFQMLTCYPTALPDLSRKRAPENSRRQGIRQSCFAKRQRNELPLTY